MNPYGRVRELKDAFERAPRYDTVLRLTLVLLLVYGPAVGEVLGVRLLCASMLVFPALMRHPYLWWALLCFVAVGSWREWYSIDNHHYLSMYWILACTISTHFHQQADQSRYLRRSAQALIAFVFFFAVVWKIIGGQYFDGSFIYFTFMVDPRFRQVASIMSGYAVEELAVVNETVGFIGRSGAVDSEVSLPTSSGLQTFAVTLSWLAVTVEGAIAVFHAIPSDRLYAIRHYGYWMFIALTYFLFPVIGFAAILTILGLAQCSEADDRRALAYVGLFGGIHLTGLPWHGLLTFF